jgi:putative phage-type endonuclease
VVTAELITPTGVLVMPAAAMRENRAAWLELRRERSGVPGRYCIGSSEVPSILDLEGVDTPAHVFRNKVWNIDTPRNEAMEFGSEFEPVIAGIWARRNRVERIDEIGLVAHAEKPWHQSTIDRRVFRCPVYKKDGRTGVCGVEIKNMGFASSSRWHRDIPDRILAQIVHQLYVTGYEHIHFAVCVGGNQLRQGIIRAANEQKLMAYVVAEVDRFRTEHLLTKVEPDWNTTDKPDKMIALAKASRPELGGVRELAFDDIDAVHEYAKAAAAESAAKTRKKQAAARLLQLADGAVAVKWSSELAYEYGETHLTKVDLDKLKERHPDAYNDPEVVTHSVSHPIKIAKTYKVTNPREGS